MAYDLSASGISSGGNDTVTVTDPGLQAGDQVILATVVGGATTATITWPSGFTLVTSANNTGASRGNACWIGIAYGSKLASYAITVQGANGTTPVLIVVGNSGRLTSAPTNYAGTSNGNGGTSPISIGLTGVTALNADDQLWFGVSNNCPAATSWSFTAPTNFTSRQTQNFAGTNGFGANLSTRNAVSAGATGTITGTATNAGQQADFLGVVVSLASTGGGGSPTYYIGSDSYY